MLNSNAICNYLPNPGVPGDRDRRGERDLDLDKLRRLRLSLESRLRRLFGLLDLLFDLDRLRERRLRLFRRCTDGGGVGVLLRYRLLGGVSSLSVLITTGDGLRDF